VTGAGAKAPALNHERGFPHDRALSAETLRMVGQWQYQSLATCSATTIEQHVWMTFHAGPSWTVASACQSNFTGSELGGTWRLPKFKLTLTAT